MSLDETQIRQVLMNLVLNASEALDDRSRAIRYTLATGTQVVVTTAFRQAAGFEGDLRDGFHVFLDGAPTAALG